MSLIRWVRWYRNLPDNPIYRRERGEWGKPNPFFDNLMRFSPFLVLGGIFFGFFGSFSNPFLVGGNEDFLLIWCLLCLPGMLLAFTTILGSLMAPALTAPMVSLERDKGTWEILLTTPQSVNAILFAKLFGALRRMRIWPILFMLTTLQGLIFLCTLTVMNQRPGLETLLIAAAAFCRPWLEILFAACGGLFFSTTVRSATMALVSTYTVVLVLKLFNNSPIWLAIGSEVFNDEAVGLAVGMIGPAAIYGVALAATLLGTLFQAGRMAS